MTKNEFIELLRNAMKDISSAICCEDGSWAVKGFIDIYKTIYTISTDTKIVSKILELYIFPKILEFANNNGLEIELTKEQNFYPDVTFKDKEGNLFAVDFKSSYRKNDTHINGMTLGAFTGYFRDRESHKNVTYPYGKYKAHIVLGIIYSTNKEIDERKIYTLEQLDDIVSVVSNITFFVQEKWKIATDKPGSGNTKNIGSINKIEDLVNGNGPFSKLGEKVFDDYWTCYLTKDTAQAAELQKPFYSNLDEYKQFKNIP